MDASQAALLKDIDPAELGQRIRASRIAKGLTQGELAGEDVSIGYVSRIEAGQRRPHAALLEQFATRLTTSVTQLLLGVSASEYDEIRLGLDYAELALESGQAEEAETRAAEVLGRARNAGLESLFERARFVHARALESLGQLDDAIIELEDLAADLQRSVLRISVGMALSRCYRESGDFARAIDTAERILRELNGTPLESADEAVQLAVTLAAAHFERGDTGQAVRVCRRALGRAENLNSPSARAVAYWNASIMEAERGSVQDAVSLASRALALLREGDSSRNLARLQMELGRLQLRLDPPAVEEARQNLEQAADQYVWANATIPDQARRDVELARVHLLDGATDAARELATQVQTKVAETLPLVAAEAAGIEGQAWMAMGHADAALDAYRRAVGHLTGIGADTGAAQLWFELAGMLEHAGDVEAALNAYRSAAASTGLHAVRNSPAEVTAPSRR